MVDRRYIDEDEKRHYLAGQQDVYSVTSIVEELEGKSEGLKWWKRHNDGEGDNPYWQHLLEYKQNRGTLGHHAALAGQYEDINNEELWGEDERESLQEIVDRVGDEDFLYSVMADKGWVETREAFDILMEEENIDIQDVLFQDLDYITSQYEKVCGEKGIDSDSIYAIEEMFVVPPEHDHDGFGGQTDILYEDPDGEVVVADIKTSSQVRAKHKYQVSAYAKAVERSDDLMPDTVDRAEIIRLYPDGEETEVYEIDDIDGYWDDFAEATQQI